MTPMEKRSVELEDMRRGKMFVSGCCEGERCHCGTPAEHKVEETIFFDDPMPHRHPLTAYICHKHFREIMGSFADNPLYTERGLQKHPE